LALLKKSPVNGHELSRNAGMLPSKIYETLGRLRHKGAVLVYESEPTLYAPVIDRTGICCLAGLSPG
jgi:sugar-specific transcriptional regulator TrmB